MKLGINSACDLRAISLLPPRGGAGRASAPPASSAAFASAAGTLPQAVPSQEQTFSLLHPKLPRLSESEAFVDQTLHRTTPARHQGFGLHDDSSKRMPPISPSSASRAQEEPQQQQPVIIPSSTVLHWNPSPTGTRCRVNEDAERRFQQLSGSVHKVGMALDSVQTNVIQLNRTMKEASVESRSVQQKFDLLEDSLQKIIKGQNDLKVLSENSTKSNPDQLNVLNFHTSKLNEISLVVSVCPEQVQADFRQLHGDIFRVLTKDMEGVVRDIRSLNTRPAVMRMLPDQNFSPNERPQRNQGVEKGSPSMNRTSVANVRPTMNQTPVANGRPLINQTPEINGSPMIISQAPVGNGRSKLKQTTVADGTPQKDRTPVANGRPHTEQIPATKSLPARSTYATRASVLKPNVEQGKVKAAHMVGTSYMLAPTQKQVLNQKVNPQEPTKKEPDKIIIGSDNDSKGCTSRVILNMEPADLRKEVVSESGPQLMWGARKRRTRSEKLPIDATTLLQGEGEKRRQRPAPEAQKGEAVHAVEAAPAKRAHRFNPKYDATQWITC